MSVNNKIQGKATVTGYKAVSSDTVEFKLQVTGSAARRAGSPREPFSGEFVLTMKRGLFTQLSFDQEFTISIEAGHESEPTADLSKLRMPYGDD